ncbi:MAG: dipeptide epimerase [Sandaracinus sp.]|nr:dipeptide epimerase [Sandaracinus sp.]MCB9619730.1 dipeptide epimerase [Sandaracinus sp.]MCB9624021.1 dipeptide epimerase [Sandaracinus sp.]MCB9635225.1 dipeptide epimerase [Sandaracinus sp.]
MIERHVSIERWPLAAPFRTARIERTHTTVVVLHLRDGVHEGRAEHVPYERYGETPEGVAAALRSLPLGTSRGGAAAGALADAWLDLTCKRQGRRAHELLGLPAPRPVATLQSLGADTPEAMADAARRTHRPVLKLKASGDAALDLARIEAVHAAAPHARLVVDANESWSEATYQRLTPRLPALGVVWLEQPFPVGDDAALSRLPHPVPVCADESVHVASDVAALRDRYDAVNVKLGKSGGLVGALATLDAARRLGMRVMVGCMVSTSLALAPAVLAAQRADLADLDGSSFLRRDRVGAPTSGRWVVPATSSFWG